MKKILSNYNTKKRKIKLRTAISKKKAKAKAKRKKKPIQQLTQQPIQQLTQQQITPIFKLIQQQRTKPHRSFLTQNHQSKFLKIKKLKNKTVPPRKRVKRTNLPLTKLIGRIN